MNKLKQVITGKLDSTYIIAEIGINHNGSLDTAVDLIYKAKDANVDAVKFQKRNLKVIYGDDILDESRKFLTDKGYVLVCSSVCNGENPFEDWWIDPYVVKEETWRPFECMGSEARNIFV